MVFTEAVRVNMREKYAQFSGRASRAEYWWFMLFVYGTGLVLALPALSNGAIGKFDTFAYTAFDYFLLAFPGIFILAVLVPSVAVEFRRFHDRTLSGWWLAGLYLAGFIAWLDWPANLAILVVAVLKGTDGHNRFGPDPLVEKSHADVFA